MADLVCINNRVFGGVVCLQIDQIHQGLGSHVSFGTRTRERVIGFKPRPQFPGPVDDRASIVP
jgi:hypothetical protein